MAKASIHALHVSHVVNDGGSMSVEAAESTVVVEQPKVSLLGSMFATAFVGALTAFMLFMAVAILLGGELLGLFFLAVGCLLGVLFLYVLRDARGKAGWRMVIGSQSLDLDLPRWRSSTHRLAPLRASVRYDDVEALETRLEAYPGWFGLTNMQRSYVLRPKTGAPIVLGEDRALHEDHLPSRLADAIEEVGRRAHRETRDLGMVVGKAGFLGLAFVAAPPWGAPSVGPERQRELWAAAKWTRRLADKAAFGKLLDSGG